MGMTSNIRIWEDNPQKDRISNVVRIEFPYKTNWCIFTLEELKQILNPIFLDASTRGETNNA